MKIIKGIQRLIKNIFHTRKAKSNTRLVWGFTLVEAIVVIAIMVILTAILLGYSRNSEKQIIFFKEESLLIGSILRAKGFAIETFQPEINPGVVSAPSRIICGWGIHFGSNGYSIFADLMPQGSPSNYCNTPAAGNFNAADIIFETFALDSNIIISQLSVNPGPSNNATLDITFIPPDPRVVFTPSNDNTEEAIIKLKLTDNSRCSLIKVNKGGRVEVDPTVTPC